MFVIVRAQPVAGFGVDRLTRGIDFVRRRGFFFDAVLHAEETIRFSEEPILADAHVFGDLAVGRRGVAPDRLAPMIGRRIEAEELDDVVDDLFWVRDHVFEEHDLEILGGEERWICSW